jgi:hypothetical protein
LKGETREGFERECQKHGWTDESLGMWSNKKTETYGHSVRYAQPVGHFLIQSDVFVTEIE